jgi:hypothetical protein
MGARPTIPPGPLRTPWTGEEQSGDPFPHLMDPQLRTLGLNTSLVRGLPSLKKVQRERGRNCNQSVRDGSLKQDNSTLTTEY